MESPKTYRGYDEDGNCKIQRTGVDANTQINPADVKAAIENVKAVFAEQMRLIATSLTNISEDADEAVVVQGTSMQGTIEDTATLLTQLTDQVTQGIDQLYDYAVTAHDQLQRNNNIDAYNSCIINGVVRIS